MIVAKPRTSTLISLGMFIALCMAGGIFGLLRLLGDVHAAWYHYALAIILLPLGTGILIRTLWNYKVIEAGKGRIHVNYPLRGRSVQFNLKEVTAWKEETIKTGSGTYRELQVTYGNGHKLDISMQEHSNYKDILAYFKSKCGSKQQHE